MRLNYLLLLSLLSFTLCEYSGVKAAITSNFFKILTKYDLNKILQNQTIIDTAEMSGQALFNYEVQVTNLWITYFKNPENVTIDQETTSDGLPQVKVTLTNVEVAIEIEHLYVKYGLISDNFYNADGDIKFSLIEGRYHFSTDGKLVLSEFNVEVEDLTIDVRKDFLNWLIGLFKGLIKSKVTDKLQELGATLQTKVNEIIENEFTVDIGHGITLNLTNTMRPNLTQLYKGERIDMTVLKFVKFLLTREELDETLTSVITFGMHGSAFPTGDPDTQADFPPHGHFTQHCPKNRNIALYLH